MKSPEERRRDSLVGYPQPVFIDPGPSEIYTRMVNRPADPIAQLFSEMGIPPHLMACQTSSAAEARARHRTATSRILQTATLLADRMTTDAVNLILRDIRRFRHTPWEGQVLRAYAQRARAMARRRRSLDNLNRYMKHDRDVRRWNRRLHQLRTRKP